MSDEAPIFGSNGAVLNSDTMQLQADWPKPAPQGMTREQWMRFLISMGFVISVTTASMIWRFV